MKKKWSLILLTFANIILISFFVTKYASRIDVHRLLHEFSNIPSGLIFGIAALNLILMFLYGYRLSYLIDERIEVGFGIASVGYAANNLLPCRLGEIVRIYFSKKKYDISAARSVFAVLCERISDLFSIGCLALIVTFAAASRLPVNKTLITIGITSPFLILLSLYLIKQNVLMQKLHQHWIYTRLIQPIISQISLKKLKALTSITPLIWIVTVMEFFIFFQHSLSGNFTLIDALCLTVCTSLSLALSTLPSGSGFFEIGIVYYLHTMKNTNETTALALAIVLHSLIVIPQIICMSYFLISKYTLPKSKCISLETIP